MNQEKLHINAEGRSVSHNVMPRITLFPRLEAIAHHAGRVLHRAVSFLPLEAPDNMSNHYHGAHDTLEKHLYDDDSLRTQLRFDLYRTYTQHEPKD